MFLLNIPWHEAQAAGALFGEKLILNEFEVFGEGDFALGINKEKEDIDYSSYGTIYEKTINTKSIFSSSNFKFQRNSLFASIRSSEHDLYNNNISIKLP